MTRCTRGHKTEVENREGIEQGSGLEKGSSRPSKGSGDELGHTFDGVEERGREVTPRQRDHMCKDKRDLKCHCHG